MLISIQRRKSEDAALQRRAVNQSRKGFANHMHLSELLALLCRPSDTLSRFKISLCESAKCKHADLGRGVLQRGGSSWKLHPRHWGAPLLHGRAIKQDPPTRWLWYHFSWHHIKKKEKKSAPRRGNTLGFGRLKPPPSFGKSSFACVVAFFLNSNSTWFEQQKKKVFPAVTSAA